MNVYVENVWISYDDNKILKENIPQPLPLPYSKIYPKIVPGIISYYNTPHFNIVFDYAVHT